VIVQNSNPLPTAELVRRALEETKELVRLEVKLAQEEVRQDVLRLKRTALFAALAALFLVLVVSTLVVALILALGGSPGSALFVAAILLGLTVALGVAAYKAFPSNPLGRTRQRLRADVKQLKEHVS
jgi:uncharacterized membrane protein YqjE